MELRCEPVETLLCRSPDALCDHLSCPSTMRWGPAGYECSRQVTHEDQTTRFQTTLGEQAISEVEEINGFVPATLCGQAGSEEPAHGAANK